MSTGEDRLIRWLRGRLGPGNRLGDDAAILPAGDAEEWAVTVDTQIEGVHFFAGLEPERVARRLLAVNLSDLAAMGATPTWAVLALSAPDDFDHRRFFDAFADAADAVGLELVGGDLSRQSTLTAVLTLIGRRAGRRFVERRGARVGHALWLGGDVAEAGLGLLLQEQSAHGQSARLDDLPTDLPAHLHEVARRSIRRHLEPSAQLDLGEWLANRPEGAAIDVSDGVGKDLFRLCAESGVGAEVEAAALPIAEDARALAEHLGADAVELAFRAGEDYVLLFTLPPGVEPPCGRRIGRVVEGDSLVLVEEESDGGERTENRRPLPTAGFDHLER